MAHLEPDTKPVARSAWWEMCEADPTATFFATPEWAEILSASYPHFRPKALYFDLGADASCLIPAIEVKRVHRQLSSLHSMPFGTYGGALSRGPVAGEQRDAAHRYFLHGGGPYLQRTLFPNPLGHALNPALVTHTGHVHSVDFSHGWQAWWDSLTKDTRYEFNKAERRGIDVRLETEAAGFETFFAHHAREAAGRDGVAVFPARFYRSLWEMRSPRIQLWTAYKKEKMIAGVLVFRFQTHMTPFLSFVLYESRSDAPSHIIYSRMYRRAIDDGVTSFNFLGSRGISSIEQFKLSMGARVWEFGYASVTGPLYGLVHHPLVPWIRRRLKRGGTS